MHDGSCSDPSGSQITWCPAPEDLSAVRPESPPSRIEYSRHTRSSKSGGERVEIHQVIKKSAKKPKKHKWRWNQQWNRRLALAALGVASGGYWLLQRFNQNAAINNVLRTPGRSFYLRPMRFAQHALHEQNGNVSLSPSRLARPLTLEPLDDKHVLIHSTVVSPPSPDSSMAEQDEWDAAPRPHQVLTVTVNGSPSRPILEFAPASIHSPRDHAWRVSVHPNPSQQAEQVASRSACPCEAENRIVRFVYNGPSSYYLAVRAHSDPAVEPSLTLAPVSDSRRRGVSLSWIMDPTQDVAPASWLEKMLFDCPLCHS